MIKCMGSHGTVRQIMMMKPHIALLPCPAMGHVTPMLQLANRLVLIHHCHVTFLHFTAEDDHRPHHLMKLPPSVTVLPLPLADISALTTGDTPLFSRHCITVRETLLRSLKPTLLQHLQQTPQAFITDMFCTQALETCAQLAIPSYILFTTSALFLSFSLFFRDTADNNKASGEFLQLPGGCKPLIIRTADLPLKYNLDDEWYRYHIKRIPKASGILLNTFEELEPEQLRAIGENSFFKEIDTPPIFPIGPLVKETEPVCGSREECIMNWLDKQPSGSVVLVAFGSFGRLCAEQISELAWGLELSQQRFLWVARAEEEKDLPEGFAERTRGTGMVVDSWVPQVRVLGHVSTGAFLSHCGWNSVMESVCNGVPLIAWPLHADQMMNATMIAEEIGVGMKVKVFGREEIGRVVRGVMKGEEGKAVKERVKEVKESALKSLAKGGSSYEALDSLLLQWKQIT
ncbi:hypothetical protein HN51_030259 [Arachis hypogaea]|nr:UDP-glycosyltransferase 72B1-like [Arachis hypogaea]QHO14725.1 Anthocyanidin 3-O-glucosyltransferase [Arachis hypogaea]